MQPAHDTERREFVNGPKPRAIPQSTTDFASLRAWIHVLVHLKDWRLKGRRSHADRGFEAALHLPFKCASVAADRFAGHMVLRHLVHVVTGDLLGFLRNVVFAPAGSGDVFIARERLALRDGREPGYLTLEAPYDRWFYLDHFTALASTAEAFVRYLRRYHASEGTRLVDPGTQQWAAVPDNGTLVFIGAMPGTWTNVVQRRHDEVSYAVFFNIAGPYQPLFEQLQAITDSLTDSDWGI